MFIYLLVGRCCFTRESFSEQPDEVSKFKQFNEVNGIMDLCNFCVNWNIIRLGKYNKVIVFCLIIFHLIISMKYNFINC